MECWALTRRGNPTGGSWRGLDHAWTRGSPCTVLREQPRPGLRTTQLPRPEPSPVVLSALSRLLARRVGGATGAPASPISGPGPTWGPEALGTPLFSCVTEEVPLSRERAWGGAGGAGGDGCGREGLGGGALASILRGEKLWVRHTRTAQLGPQRPPLRERKETARERLGAAQHLCVVSQPHQAP